MQMRMQMQVTTQKITRTITITNVLPSMKWTVSSGDAPLPVQLASLTSSITGRNVSLKWSTSQEINNSGFEIERKNNGGDFVKVGFVMGKGTVSTTTNYEFSDRNLASGNYSYRLKHLAVYLNTKDLEHLNIQKKLY